MGKKDGRITIKEIAVESGFSVQAVSLALRGKKEIPERTRQKIEEIAEKMGYIKNYSASILKSGRSQTIAVVYSSTINPWVTIMVDCMQRAFDSFGFRIMLYNQQSQILDQDMFMNIISRNIDGIVTFLEPVEGVLPLSIQYKKPILLLGVKSRIQNLDCIFVDDIMGGEIAAQALVDKGCQQFLFIGYNTNNNSQIKCESFHTKLDQLGLRTNQLDLDNTTTDEAIKTYFEQNSPKDLGIFCFNDITALEVLAVLQEQNIEGNIKIIGYDDIQSTIRMPDRLTTIGSDKMQMAQVAAEVIAFKVNNPQKFDKVFRKEQSVYLVQGKQ